MVALSSLVDTALSPLVGLHAGVDDVALAQLMRDHAARLRTAVGRRVIGQERVVELMLLSLFCRGHALLMGAPGLAKTLLVQSLADALGLSFNRVQFTPDLMPSDITGTDVLEEDKSTGVRSFRFVPGPVFANVLLADEVNRSPAKTQSALLQAMQEQRVTVAGRTFALPDPFLVFATQNPIEQEGTYPLPEAQLDRFLFFIEVDYPSAEDELRVVAMTTAKAPAAIEAVLSLAEVQAFQALVRRVPVPESVLRFAVDLARATRPEAHSSQNAQNDNLGGRVAFGAGPRASQGMVLAAKARALLQGRFAASIEDVVAIAPAVLVHRVVPSFQAQAAGISTRTIVADVLAAATKASPARR
jgi:MoxR-like ATPase